MASRFMDARAAAPPPPTNQARRLPVLCLTRKQGEAVRVGDDVEVIVAEVKGNRVRLLFSAPESVKVLRRELWVDVKQQETGCANHE
jgi:carbon storage regulator